MKLIYCLVGKGGRVLHSYSNSSGNFASIATDILNKKETEGELKYGSLTFYWLFDSGYQYLCLGEKLSKSQADALLNKIKECWANYFNSSSAVLNSDFTRILQHIMENLTEKFMQETANNIEYVQQDLITDTPAQDPDKIQTMKKSKKGKKQKKEQPFANGAATYSLLNTGNVLFVPIITLYRGTNYSP